MITIIIPKDMMIIYNSVANDANGMSWVVSTVL